MNRTWIGYARVSTVDQEPALQEDALSGAGCVRIFTEHVSGASSRRPELARAMDQLRPGDSLVVWRLDRLGRSLSDLVRIMEELRERDVELVSLTEGIDTSTVTGRLMYQVTAAFAEFERSVIRERTMAGLAAAAARGRRGGRPTVVTEAKLSAAGVMLAAGRSQRETAEALGVSRTSLARALARVQA